MNVDRASIVREHTDIEREASSFHLGGVHVTMMGEIEDAQHAARQKRGGGRRRPEIFVVVGHVPTRTYVRRLQAGMDLDSVSQS